MPGTINPLRWVCGLLGKRTHRQADDLQCRQLLVDVSTIIQHDARTGIQRVVRAIWLQLLATDLSGVRLVPVFATVKRGYCEASPDFLTTGMPDRPVSVRVAAGDIFLGLDLAAHRLWRHRRQIAGWKRRGVGVHIIVYDMLPLTHPHWFPDSTGRHFRRWMKILLRHADQLIGISAHVADEMRDWLGAHGGRRASEIGIARIMLSGDLSASAPSKGIAERDRALLDHMATVPTVLMVGTIEPRKAHDKALDAMEWLWAQDGDAPMLVIAGRPGWRTEALQQRLLDHPLRGEQLYWLSDVSDELLTELYRRAALVLVPSHGEGFGLPIIEALDQGCKVLARDLPVFRELERPGLHFFPSDAPADLAATLMAALPCPQPQTPTERRGWDEATADLLDALKLVSR
ncbi:Glycosyltransferase involved in cell wall bisynthesis [Sphingobium sp. AP50]|uniref:glycosyltransferase family 4 protein n=1 Tax=Sphingobium sp. AP50 TaxID=1884369 RepID=UPI0008C961FA|nr:glycosyltransferase family 1 protein [Sphingobium sp. AP50]SEJ78791.1 Glycosyltransferase involved in cell wall bisynthesis [Sphingobium sp. AP50]